jgi:hypothetical protein
VLGRWLRPRWRRCRRWTSGWGASSAASSTPTRTGARVGSGRAAAAPLDSRVCACAGACVRVLPPALSTRLRLALLLPPLLLAIPRTASMWRRLTWASRSRARSCLGESVGPAAHASLRAQLQAAGLAAHVA